MTLGGGFGSLLCADGITRVPVRLETGGLTDLRFCYTITMLLSSLRCKLRATSERWGWPSLRLAIVETAG